jgi:hypothetical protein
MTVDPRFAERRKWSRANRGDLVFALDRSGQFL